jgi:hypothetical protein
MNFAFARNAAIAMLALMAAALPQFARAQNAPLTGTWKFDAAKSAFMPGPARYKDMTLTFGDAAGNVVNLEGMDADGGPVKATLNSVPDGKSHPITGLKGVETGTWTRAGDTTVTYQYYRGRNIAVLGNRVMLPDGTITFREQMYDPNGKQIGTQVLVFLNPEIKQASAKPAAPAAPAAPKSQFTPQETEALASLDKNDNDGAIRLFTAIIDAKPASPMLYYDYGSRAIAYLRKGQEDQALADFSAAIKLKADDGDSYFRRGAIKFGRMDYQAAIDDLSVAIMSDPMNADAYNMRSFSYYRLMQNDKGAADTEKACALKKDYCVN